MFKKNNLYAILYIAISLLFYFQFYFLPLNSLDAFTTATQNPLYTDSNFYEHVSTEIYNNAGDNWILIGTTWWSWGVIGFGTLMKFVLGGFTHSTIVGNIILNLVSIKLLINSGFKRIHVYMAFCMPFYFSYSMMLSKEVLCVLSISLLIYSLSNKKVLLLLLALMVSLLTRGILFVGLSMIIFYNQLPRNNIFKFIRFRYFVFALIILIATYFGIEYEAKSIVESVLLSLMGPVDALRIIFMAIPRALVWLISPIPIVDLVKISGFFDGDSYIFWQGYLYLSRIISSILIISILMFEVYRYITKGSIRIDIYILGIVILFSSLAFLEGARYRSIIEPFIFLRFVTSIYDIKSLFDWRFR
jgi:hypothetical protein